MDRKKEKRKNGQTKRQRESISLKRQADRQMEEQADKKTHRVNKFEKIGGQTNGQTKKPDRVIKFDRKKDRQSQSI